MVNHELYRAFRERYQKKDTITLGMTCSTVSPIMVEMIGHAGFDFVIIDTEVLCINPETIENMIRAAECSGIIPLVKLKSNDPKLISDTLNAGAPVVKFPHCKSADDIKRAVDAAYFYPRGNRGLCTVSRANKFAQGNMKDLIEWTNREVQICPLVEDREAIEKIVEIMSVEGVDFYEFGPVDLSQSYRVAPDKGLTNPQVAAALDRTLEAANKYNKRILTVPIFGSEVPITPELVQEKLINRGINMIFMRPDSVMMRGVLRDAMRIREL